MRTALHTNVRGREADLAGRAYQEIRAAILEMRLQPGQPLQEQALASWLGTSRTPVREAIRRLQAEGLVDQPSGRGVAVAQVSAEDVEDAYHILEALEGLSSRLAAERLTEEGARAIREALDRLQRAAGAADVESWTQADAALHEAIRAVAANAKLTQLLTQVYPVVERVRSIYLKEGTEPDRLQLATADHLALGEAILAGDAAKAEALGRHVFAWGGRANVRLLRHWVSPLRRQF